MKSDLNLDDERLAARYLVICTSGALDLNKGYLSYYCALLIVVILYLTILLKLDNLQCIGETNPQEGPKL